MEFVNMLINAIGTATTIAAILAFFYKIICWFLGITPIVKRLGFGLWRREISIVAKTKDSFEDIKRDLVSSGVFRDKNIKYINDNNLLDLKKSSIILLHEDMVNALEQVANSRPSRSGLIVYCPQKRLEEAQMNLINSNPNSIVVNFRGRLLNDVIMMLVSTSYVEN